MLKTAHNSPHLLQVLPPSLATSYLPMLILVVLEFLQFSEQRVGGAIRVQVVILVVMVTKNELDSVARVLWCDGV